MLNFRLKLAPPQYKKGKLSVRTGNGAGSDGWRRKEGGGGAFGQGTEEDASHYAVHESDISLKETKEYSVDVVALLFLISPKPQHPD